MTLCYLALGSNLRVPPRQLRLALHKLSKCPKTMISNCSRLYSSNPLGIRSQPKYYNMVIEIKTSLHPALLLKHCQRIENEQGRIRKVHWGQRIIDIDILLYGQSVIHTLELTIPHPEMLKRDFVLVPLLEIAPTICLPSGEPIAPYLKSCQSYLSRREPKFGS